MEECSTSKFVQLSKNIFVPQEWPISGIETFLIKLAKTVINDVTSDTFVVLQVHNIPTVLVRDDRTYETRYFFEKITKPWLIDAYVIDVVFGKNDVSDTNSMESEDSTADEVSLDDYIIITHQGENRTAYYLISSEESVRAVSPAKRRDFEIQNISAQRAKRQAMGCDVLLLLVAAAIAGLTYTISMNTTQKQFCVIKFREMLFLDTEQYQLVPSTWILSGSEKEVMIAFPLMNKTKLSNVAQKRIPPNDKWLSFPASIEYASDNFEDAEVALDLIQ